MNKDEEEKIDRALMVGELGDHAEKLFNRRLAKTFASYGIETNNLFYHELVSHGLTLRLLVEHLGSYNPGDWDDKAVKAYIEKVDEEFAQVARDIIEQNIKALAREGITVSESVTFTDGRR